MSDWEKNIRRVTPYIPGEQPQESFVIKLNTNENPYPPSKRVTEVLHNFDAALLRKYPDPAVLELTEALSDAYGVSEDQIFVGVGSDDVIAMSFLAFFHSSKPILFPDITYSFYDVWAEEFDIPYHTIPLKDDFAIDVSEYMIENGGIILPNPNAPTGVLLDISSIERILEVNQKSVVIIDEAYIDFGGESVLPFIDKYDNLLLVRTFSKSRALAGSRIGYAFGSKKLISYLLDVKYSFNSYTMDSLTMKIGKAAMEDMDYFAETTAKIIKTREWTKQQLKALGFSFTDSYANFIFARPQDGDARALFEALKQEKIYVRYFNKPRIDDYLRISIGTQEEMEVLIGFLKKYYL